MREYAGSSTQWSRSLHWDNKHAISTIKITAVSDEASPVRSFDVDRGLLKLHSPMAFESLPYFLLHIHNMLHIIIYYSSV